LISKQQAPLPVPVEVQNLLVPPNLNLAKQP